LINLLVCIIGGGIAGWLASLAVQGTGMGVIGDSIVSIVGALLAGIVGAAVALIYHLSHRDSLYHAAQRYSEMRAEDQRMRTNSLERR
jgi:uncharacterized membrane protein YeaQ/YmgE (transglycosylase-associated protein family)